MRELILIALFGGAGAVSRYTISQWVHQRCGHAFPYGTLLVNVVGCFLLGLLLRIFQNTEWLSPPLRLGLTVGLLGGLTTFSTFGYETLNHFQDGRTALAALNVAANVAIGLLAVAGGIAAARLFISSG